MKLASAVDDRSRLRLCWHSWSILSFDVCHDVNGMEVIESGLLFIDVVVSVEKALVR